MILSKALNYFRNEKIYSILLGSLFACVASFCHYEYELSLFLKLKFSKVG